MGPIKNTLSYKTEISSTTWKEWKKDKLNRKKKKEEKLIESLEKALQDTRETKTAEEEVFDNVGRIWTVSIALPGNILQNAQTCELKTLLAGQIARAAAIFNIDEVYASGYP
jgi:hypothetical protein